MAELVSINRKDFFQDSDDALRGIEPHESDEDCRVEMEWPATVNRVDNEKSGLNKSPSMSSFCCKRTPINVEWRNVCLTTKKGKEILKQLSGTVYSGELTAIMGPSGAGKSSLLNTLSGITRQKLTGQILVNGANREMRVFRKLTCYILQDDHILPRLTVTEIVSIAASLKIPSSVPKQQRQAMVDECLRCLGLEAQKNQKAGSLSGGQRKRLCIAPHIVPQTEEQVDECLRCLGLEAQKNQKAASLSGGQRKRLCIAQELVSNPNLIFLDEPTSGLDSSSCLQCIQLLKSLAEEGRTVVCTIHQPSSKVFEIFDKLYMLAEGHCIYRGRTDYLIPFLAEQGLHCPQYHNPTDYVTEISMGDYGDWKWKLKKAMDAIDDVNDNISLANIHASESKQTPNIQSSTVSLIQNNYPKKPSVPQEKLGYSTRNGFATSSLNQFRVLFWRNFLCTFREPMNSHLKIVGNILIGLLLGCVYFNIGNDASKVYNNAALLFCITTFLIFTSMIPMLLMFPAQSAIFEREHMNSWYSLTSYYLATTISEIPFQVLCPIISCSITYWMTSQPNDLFRFGFFLLAAVLVSLTSQAVGQLIGAGVSVQNAVYITSVVCIPILLFCGFFIPLNSIPVYLRWLSHVSFARYTFQSMMKTLYSMDRPFLFCNKTMCPFEDPQVILDELDIAGNIYVDYGAIMGSFLLFRIATYIVLKLRTIRIH